MPRIGKILIVEDEYIIAMEIKIRLESFGYEVLDIVDSGEEALKLLTDGIAADVVLMDIHLRGRMDGIEAAAQIARQYHKPVVFITAFSDDATLDKAKESMAYGFVKKPINGEILKLTVEMAISRHQQHIRDRRLQEKTVRPVKPTPLKKITIWNEDGMVLLDPREIYYLEINKGFISFRTRDSHYEQRGTLTAWIDKLAAYGFYRCHKNFLVNLDKIQRITLDINSSYILCMKNIDDQVPVARNKTSDLKEILEL